MTQHPKMTEQHSSGTLSSTSRGTSPLPGAEGASSVAHDLLVNCAEFLPTMFERRKPLHPGLSRRKNHLNQEIQ